MTHRVSIEISSDTVNRLTLFAKKSDDNLWDNTINRLLDELEAHRKAHKKRVDEWDEFKGVIRKPGKPEPNALKNFKSDLHDILPELKDLTEEELSRILGDNNDV